MSALLTAFGTYAGIRFADYVAGKVQDHFYKWPSLEFADELTNVLLFLKTKTRLVGLGDTGHDNPALACYLASRPHLERMGEHGFSYYFLETFSQCNPGFKALQRGWTKEYPSLQAGSWVRAPISELLNRRLCQALYNLPSPEFVGVDDRSVEICRSLPVTKYGPIVALAVLHALLLPKSTTQALWVKRFLPEMKRGVAHKEKKFIEFILDDMARCKAICRNMCESNGAGLVVFGQGHFCGYREWLLDRPGMTALLAETYKDFQRVDLYLSDKSRAKTVAGVQKHKSEAYFRPAEIDFVVQKKGPPKLIFNKPELEVEYLAFKANPPQPEAKPSVAKRDPIWGL